ncbi:FAD-dependent oxidoreductase [Microbispora sp. GKU 823]|uniref:FAD-dependent oxidoreductase n=1 Tax=Microbispora sp. GKU 823 TaxID=1652100 RepID=UPI0009A30173|nr:FAD-dependent oxidoreductase [Microbispora sp. GKU 823]OPG07551.1 FAD-dependent oxidoreductase [Microbispora sp. GKU 823]
MTRPRHFDLVVVGGGLGGVAAALAAARLGLRSVLVSECDWIGGQVSSQGIPPDEHPWIESVGCTAAYREFRDRVRAFYRRNYPLTAEARAARRLNPGSGNIGPLSHEPQVAWLVLEEMVAPWTSRGLITVLRGYRAAAASTGGDEVRSVLVRGPEGDEIELTGAFFLDATDLGDLIDLAGVEHVHGAESSAETGEPHALPGPADPFDQQAVTWALLLSLHPGTDNTIERPAGYAAWRDYRPAEWPGPLLSWEVSDHVTHRTRRRPLFTDTEPAGGVRYDLWHARRVLDSGHLGSGWSDVTAAAWPMMDYARLPLIGVSEQERELALHEARQLSLSFLYWMQTEAPRHDGGHGYPELRPRGDLTGTPDGLAKMPYIRESRRIRAEFTLLEQHIGVEARAGLHGAERFPDSVGVAAYRIDVHPSTSGRPTVDIDTWPFQIPLGSLVPVRVTNLLPAAKNIGSTHLTSGAYRVHPGEWTVGEAAGALAGFCVLRRTRPAQVRADGIRLDEFQTLLSGTLGVELEWPRYEALAPRHRFGYVPQAASQERSA